MTKRNDREDSMGRTLREQTRQWILAAGTILAVVATVLGFLSDSLGLWEQVRPILGEVTPTPAMMVVQPVPFTQTNNFAQTNVSPPLVPTATTVPLMSADDETLLIVAQFANYAQDANFNVAGRISEALTKQVEAAQLEETRVEIWPQMVEGEAGAMVLLDATRATMLIWGEYDSGRVRVNFALRDAVLDWEKLLRTPDELSTTINLDLPREAQVLALMALGRLYRDQDDLAKATAAFRQALALEPTSLDTTATLNFYLGYLATHQSPADYAAAIDAYSTVIDLRPDWVNARYNRGGAYLDRYWQTGEPTDLDLAIEDFAWTVEAREEYAEAYVNRGVAYYTRQAHGDVARAIEDFDAAIMYDPELTRAYYNRGLAHIRADHPELWEADLLHTLEMLPGYWPANYALCWGYALDRRPEEGLPYCEAAVATNTSGAVRDAHGLVMAQLGRYDEAADDIEQYVAWLDNQPRGIVNLASGPDYAAMIDALRQGENPVTPELLAQLR